MRTHLNRLLEHPWVYRLQELILAPGARSAILRRIEEILEQVSSGGRLLDVGCGPSSWLFGVGLHPTGVDISSSYLNEYARSGSSALVASAEALPFSSQSFDGVWNIGLLHHLPDGVAARAISEMVRVCKPTGYVVIFDAVMPRNKWQRPLAYLIRRLDRGKFMRSEAALRDVLPDSIPWHCRRVTYTGTGLEALVCWWRFADRIEGEHRTRTD